MFALHQIIMSNWKLWAYIQIRSLFHTQIGSLQMNVWAVWLWVNCQYYCNKNGKFKITKQFKEADNSVSHSSKTANILFIWSRTTDFQLGWTWDYEAPLQGSFSRQIFVPKHSIYTSIIWFSLVPRWGCMHLYILTTLDSLEILANYLYLQTNELISLPTTYLM